MKLNNWGWAAAPLLLIGLGLFIIPSYWPAERGYAFLGVTLLLAIELVVIGCLINGRPGGAFIDNRNRLSLSKLQAAAWTVIVLSAFATAAAFNTAGPNVDYTIVGGLFPSIPGELLLAMGISATSLVATPALLSLKAAETPSQGAVTQAAATPGTAAMVPNGKVATNTTSDAASWGDLVTGDEVGNAGSPDLGKIQQLLITLILLAAYAGYVYQQFTTTSGHITTLPALDKSFVWLMGISHASYLAYKAAPHTATEPGS